MDAVKEQKRKLYTAEQDKRDEEARKLKSARQAVLNALGPEGSKIRRAVGSLLFLNDKEIEQAKKVLDQVLAVK